MNGATEQNETTRQQVPHERVVSLRYSKTPPSVPGWYWQKDHHKKERCMQVIEARGRMCVEGFTMFGGRDYFPIEEKRDICWAGPIQKPESN